MGNGSFINDKAPVPTPEELSIYPENSNEQMWSEKPDGCAIIRFAKKGAASEKECPASTMAQMMEMAAKRKPKLIALLQEPPSRVALPAGDKKARPPPPLPLNEWRKWTWEKYYRDARQAGRAMIELGMLQHDTCSIFGFNSPEWMISCAATWIAGGKSSGIYPSDTKAQFEYKVYQSRTSILVVEGKEQLDMTEASIGNLPYLKAVIVWGMEPTKSELNNGKVKVLSWKAFMELGGKTKDDTLTARTALIKPGHACSIIYTSGTTGNAKGVMVTHDNFIYEACAVMTQGVSNIANHPNDLERIISYLPLSHVAGQMVDITCPIVVTAKRPGALQVWFARPYDLKLGTLVERLKNARPTCFLGVPRVWEKIAERLQAIGAKNTGIKKWLGDTAKAKGLTYSKNLQLGGSGSKPSNYGLYETIVFKNIKAALGLDKMKFCFTGAAPIRVETLQYFGSIGININEVYGMSECTGATTWSTEGAHTWGSVGFALSGMEVKIFKTIQTSQPNLLKPGFTMRECPRTKNSLHQSTFPEECHGEICYRGRHIMLGYLANPDMGEDHVRDIKLKNADTIDANGWLHSGDMGVMHESGMVKITGRYKELIIGAGGENIAPVPIEDAIKVAGHNVISNVQMIGDKRKFNVALITLTCKGATGEKPGTNELDGPAASLVPGCKTIQDACSNEVFIKFLENCIKTANSNGDVCPSNAAKIQRFTVLPMDFSVETGSLTATLKLKRSVAEKMYSNAIEAMYNEALDGSNKMFVPFVE
jgi:long-chain-fatty-acid--CoA ligase ACSBG